MLQVVDLGGDPHARGLAGGCVLAARAQAHLADWRASLAAVTGLDADDYLRRMLRETDYVTAVRRHTPDVLEEVRGFAQGAGVDPDLMFALQLLDEEWAYRRRAGLSRRTPGKCSSIAIVDAGSPTWIGQNMDLGRYTDGHQVALRIAGEGGAPASLVFTTAGVIALMGVNAAGLGVCVNSLPQLPSAPEGVPVAFVVRRLLQARTLAEAAALVLELPHATSQHYLLAEPGSLRSFEASAAGVTEYQPPDPRRIFHTNHPLADEQGAPETAAARHNSVQRLASVVGRLADGAPGLAAIQVALSACDDPDNPVCRTGGDGDIGFTCGSMISALSPAAVESWVSPGPPSQAGYERFSLVRDSASAA